jgi:lipopolysaccharide export LptBFGC system permease protein LptF
MKYLKVAGVAWGLIYFATGAIKSFTFNSNDTWASVALIFALFLLPLPITVIAVWFPRVAGKALLACIAVNLVAMTAVVVARHTYPLSDMGHFAVFIALYDFPHLAFALAYMRAGGPGAGDEK